MYIIKNALKNVLRNKNRNLMMGAIIFVIILTTVVTLIINNTASAVIEDYKERFGSKVLLTPNMERAQEESATIEEGGAMVSFMPTISSELYLKFADSEHLQKSIIKSSTYVDSNDITAVDQDNGQNGAAERMSFSATESYAFGNYKLNGDSWQDFDDGLRTLETGTFPEKENECLVSTNLRDLNQLKIGDTINFFTTLYTIFDVSQYSDLQVGDSVTIGEMDYTVSAISGSYGEAERLVEYPLTISGFYNDFNNDYEIENMPKFTVFNKKNEVLTTSASLLAGKNPERCGISVSATYFLKNPELLSDFEAEIRGKGLPNSFDVGTDSASYNNIVKPVVGLKNISMTFMIIVLVLGCIVLVLLTSISVRERKYEIGVLRAMGMKKMKVALGLWTEILAITGICLVLGLGMGTALSQPVSDALLQNQVAAVEDASGQMPGGGYSFSGGTIFNSSGKDVQPLSEMEITLDWLTIAEIVAISLLLASLAGAVSISKITKYEPIKILMERD